MRSLNIGATGMLAQQLNVEVISHNIANEHHSVSAAACGIPRFTISKPAASLVPIHQMRAQSCQLVFRSASA